jgi:hypothetical protein
MIYEVLIRSKTDYGFILLKNAKTNHLNMIQTKLNTAIRLSIGGLKSSPIESIRNIANEISHGTQHSMLTLLYLNSKKKTQCPPYIKTCSITYCKNIQTACIYTDASKTNDGVSLAMIINNQTIAYKNPPQTSIFTAESMAIYKAVKYLHAEYANHQTKCIILSDSLSNLIAITNTQNQTDSTKLIQEETFLGENKNKHIHFV